MSDQNPYVGPKQAGNALPEFPYVNQRARLLLVGCALGGCALSSIAGIALDYYMLTLVAQHGLSTVPDDTVRLTDLLDALIYVFDRLTALAAIVLFSMFVYRANHNARRLGAKRMRFTPAWTVGWFFVPIFNLVRPYGAVREIWQVSGKRTSATAETPGFLLFWWWTWIASVVLERLSFRFDQETLELYTNSLWVDIAAQATRILAAVLAFAVLRAIHERQQARAERLHR
ncbi:MAG: DUF4328 domain-containing protein [Polyangiaceae bacterium]